MIQRCNRIFLLIVLICFSINLSYAQAELEVEGDTEARIMIKSSSFGNPTTLRFESGLPTGAFTNYIIRNQNDLLHFDVESDFIGNELGFFELGPSILRHSNLAQGQIALLAADEFGNISKYNPTKEINFPAQVLSRVPNNTDIRPETYGLLWKNNFGSAAWLAIRRPVDWDNVSDIILTVYFIPITAATGTAAFSARHSDYNLGDNILNNDLNVNSALVTTTGSFEIHKATIILPAFQLSKEFWNIAIQRFTSGTTYTDDVIVMNVTVEYKSSL